MQEEEEREEGGRRAKAFLTGDLRRWVQMKSKENAATDKGEEEEVVALDVQVE